jgi:hypothetical protein
MNQRKEPGIFVNQRNRILNDRKNEPGVLGCELAGFPIVLFVLLYFWFSKIPGNGVLLLPGFVLFKSTKVKIKTPPFWERLLNPDLYFERDVVLFQMLCRKAAY